MYKNVLCVFLLRGIFFFSFSIPIEKRKKCSWGNFNIKKSECQIFCSTRWRIFCIINFSEISKIEALFRKSKGGTKFLRNI